MRRPWSLRGYDALLGLLGQHPKGRRPAVAIRVVLLGLRVRRVAGGVGLRLHPGQHAAASGRSFLADLAQADPGNLGSALLGGVIFNAANILLVAAIALSGMAVAFPVGIGLALVLGVVVNYVGRAGGQPVRAVRWAWPSSRRPSCWTPWPTAELPGQESDRPPQGPGVGRALRHLDGLLLSLRCRRPCPSPEQFAAMPAGKLSPYTAMVFFALGILLSNFVLNTVIMRRPFSGPPVPLSDYFKGTARDHLWGIVGGMIWAVGMTLNIVAAGKASFAISYGLGQGATMVAAFWGVFIWREFRDAPRGTARLLGLMFARIHRRPGAGDRVADGLRKGIGD